MTGARTGRNARLALTLATALCAWSARAEEVAAPGAAPAAAPNLEAQFRDPPQSARPRVWWHWMNGNISKDGIAKDMAWMKSVGIGGLQNFDANLQTPQVVDKRLVYMTPEWKDAFAFAAREADRQGLELAVAASPGWSETGGPWVPAEDGLKKLVWSETPVAGGKRFTGVLAAPPQVTGPFQTIAKQPDIDELLGNGKAPEMPHHYADVAVLAVPVADAPVLAAPRVTSGGVAVDAAKLSDGDLGSFIEINGAGSEPPALTFAYLTAQTIRSASLFAPGSAAMFGGSSIAPRLEASDDGTAWRPVADIPGGQVPTTVSFAPVTARWFRVVFAPRPLNIASLGAPAPGIDPGPFAAMASAMGQKKALKVGDLRLSGEPVIDRFEAKAGYEIEENYYALSQGVPESAGPAAAQVIDLTARLKPDGTLDWTAPRLPAGARWKVLRLGYSLLGTTNHPAPREATGLEVDKFDGAAVRRYLDHYLGMYRDASGGMLGKRGVQALLTDSIEVGAANWTPRMIEQFRRLRGYDPTPWLPALTGTIIGSRADSDRFLYDYRRTLADLMASEHYGTVAEVAHANGLRVYGEALEDHRPSLGDDMTMRKAADVPMSAMWTFSRQQGPKPTYLADIKGAASVAHIYGQNLVAAESMTAAMQPWAYGPADLKRFIDLEFVTGVNRPVVHTSVHVPVDDRKPGLSLFIFGQYFNRNESWAELARPWVDYMARNALMLQQGRNVADVAYFYGEEAPLTGLYGDKPVADAPRANAYDFLSFDALANAVRNDGDAVVSQGGARYRAIYLGGSSRRMTLAALQRLAALAEGGATIVGPKPEATPSLSGDAAAYAALVAKLWPGTAVAQVGKGRVIASADIDAALAQIGVAPDFRFSGGQDGADIPFLHRAFAGGESWFLVNRRNRPETIEAHFRVTGKAPELWHAETGTSEPASYRVEGGETIVPLALGAEDAVHVVFRTPTDAAQRTVTAPARVEKARLDDKWSVAFQPGRGAPASATLATLAPLDQNADPAIRYFSGIATYARDFAAPKGWKPGQALVLDLGEAREVAEVRINGQQAGYAWHAPYTIDIGHFVKPGRNHVEVRVANLWVNRLVGDAQPGAAKVTWTAMPTYRADAPLRRSGLIGPVRLMQ
ncbi:MAG: glycoside hydrolase [Sphingomonadales bacterium]|nr:glycoside hydrolase [Sphingomonadales bacterium]